MNLHRQQDATWPNPMGRFWALLARSRKEAGPKAAQQALPLQKVVEQVGSDPT